MARPKLDELKGYAVKAARGDRPFRYSDEYGDWFRAALRGDEEKMEESSARWRRRFGIVIPRPRRRRRSHD